MNKECRYIESTEYGNYCNLNHQICNNPTPSDQCKDIKEYWRYLEAMGVQITADEEIEEIF